MAGRKETDLYQPVKRFLEAQGYTVRGEVQRCDLVAVRAEELLIVELKRAFTLGLLLQGIARQQLAEAVYLAVERPGRGRSGPRWSEVQQLCRRLGLGLLTVAFGPGAPRVEAVCDPGPYTPRRLRKRQGLLLKEFSRRSGDYNVGGSTRRPLVTAYREEVLRLAFHLQAHGPSAVRDLRAATGVKDAGAALRRDYYGWFERIGRGVYRLSPKGEQALQVYADVVAAGEGSPEPRANS